MKMTREAILAIQVEHSKWLTNTTTGKRADFSNTDLSGADLSGCNFSYANFANCNLTGARMFHGSLVGCALTVEQLMSAHFHCITYQYADGSCLILSSHALDILVGSLPSGGINVDDYIRFLSGII